jgi:anionic cell wall polymer biosynthesis LytR-Cps2A-Psr (LCP) family protein
MSFDDGEDKFGDEDFDKEYSEDMNRKKRGSNDFEDDFFKDEDFNFDEESASNVESEGFRIKRIKQKKKKRKTIFKIIGILAALVVVAVVVVFWGIPWIKSLIPAEVEIPEEERISVPSSLELTQDINMVIACADQDLLEPEVSSIMFSKYYSMEEKLITLCIPVKTLLDVPGIGAGLVGESVEIGGMDLLSLTLERNLGMDMEVNHYILMDIYNVVNKLNGINLELDEEMTIKNYDDNSTFELKKGENLIDGTEALNFLKFFGGIEEDIPIGNITKQKLLFDAVIEKIVGETEEELSANLNLIDDFIDTDLSLEEELKIFSTFSEIESSKNNVYPLDVSSTELAEEEIVYLPDVSELAEIFEMEESVSEEVTVTAEETVNLTIFNGEGTPGLAKQVADLLGDQLFESGKNKYNVLEVANEPTEKFNYAVTEIIIYTDQSYVVEAADDLKNILGVGNVTTKENESIESDIIIILGADYKSGVAGSEDTAEEDGIIEINILNGEGTALLAATAQKILEEHFNAEEEVLEVVETKDAGNWDYEQTEIIIFNSGEKVNELAQKIQERLGVGVIKYSDDNVDNVDISIILGSDYTNQ